MVFFFRRFKFTAFSIEDLLGDATAGGSLELGSSFTTPLSASVRFSVLDNDRRLSGDARRNEVGDDFFGQVSDIRQNEALTFDNAKIYAERMFVLRDKSGQRFQLIEIEVVDQATDERAVFYTFRGSLPDPASTLTVVAERNVVGGIRYDDLSAGLNWQLGDDQSVRIEAEELNLERYRTERVDAASGGEVVRLTGRSGEASLIFGAQTGTYDLTISYVDENDGQGLLRVFVGDQLVETVRLDQDSDGRGGRRSSISEFTIEDLELQTGDQVRLVGVRDRGEYVRIDALTFELQDGTGENSAPVADPLSISGDEDTVISGLLTASDVDGDTLSFAAGDPPANGSVVINPDGTFDYTPNADFAGEDSFTFNVTDGEETATNTVTVTVDPVNDAPVADPLSISGDEDTVISGLLTASDVDGDTLSFAAGDPPANGSVVINPDGTFDYTPNADFAGEDSFTFNVTDGQETATNTVTVTVDSINDAPVADPLSISGDEDTIISGLLTASDVDGDTLSFAAGDPPANGSVVINPDGTFDYTPNADFAGEDSFTYTVTDGEETATNTVTVTVDPVNDAPVADPLSISGDEDTIISGLLTASDVDGDTLSFAAGDPPANGTVVINPDGTFDYTPNADFAGEDSFTFNVTDGPETVTNIVTVTVDPINDAPVADPLSISGDEDTIISGRLTASDVDGDTLSFAAGDPPANGTVVINPDGTFDYTPNADFAGEDSFTYTVTDGQETATNTVTVTVNEQDDDILPPTLEAQLALDSGAFNDDALTNAVQISGTVLDDTGVAFLQIRVSSSGTEDFVDVSSELLPDGSFIIGEATIAEANGGPLPDGSLTVEIRAGDSAGNLSEVSTIELTLDTVSPEINDAPSGVFTEAPQELRISFNEAIDPASLTPDAFTLVDGNGVAIEIGSVEIAGSATVAINLTTEVPNGDFTLTVNDTVRDLAGNALAESQSFGFSVNDQPGIESVSPATGEAGVNVMREITVRFDEPVDASTVTSETFQVTVAGRPVSGRLEVSLNGRQATLFPDEPLPGSTRGIITVDGNQILTRDGRPIDADGDNEAGGILQSRFDTINLTSVPGTSVEGFVLDSNRQDADGNDIPIQGVRLIVEGRPDLFAVTDENGFFRLENLPGTDFFFELNTENAIAPDGFVYGGLVEPYRATPGVGTTLTGPNGEPFSIYLPLMPTDEGTEYVAGEEVRVGLGETAAQNLAEILPDADPEMLNLLSVTIPDDVMLTRDDGSPADELIISVLDPERLPGPTPPGVDFDYIFTLDAGDADNVDGFATVTFPNLDGLAPGESRPVFSFDHDAGEWVITGQAVVSEDGSVLETTEGGVRTLGWRGLGRDETPPEGELREPEGKFDNPGLRDAALDVGSEALGLTSAAASILPPGILSNGASLLNSIFGGARSQIDQGFLGLPDPDDLSAAERTEVFVNAGATVTGIGAATIAIFAGSAIVPLAIATGLAAAFAGAAFTFQAARYGEAIGNLLNEFDEACPPDTTANLSAFGTISHDSISTLTADSLHTAELGAPVALQEMAEAAELLNAIEAGIASLEAIDNAASEVFLQRFGNGLNANFGGEEFEGLIVEFDTEFQLIRVLDQEGNIASNPNTGSPFQFDYQETIDDIVRSANTAPIDLEINLDREIGIAQDFVSSLVDGRLDAQVSNIQDEVQQMLATVSSPVGGVSYRVSADGFELRGQTNTDGSFQLPFVRNKQVEVEFADPLSGLYGSQRIFADNQDTLQFFGVLSESQDIDSDGDGLTDQIEGVIGTLFNEPDSDSDGITDLAEIEQGLNPLDGVGFPTGVIATLQLNGDAKDVTVEGNIDGFGGQTAYVATGNAGLAIIDATQFNQPILLSQIDLPGDNADVAVDTGRGLAYVAAGTAGLHIVDVSDAENPSLQTTVSIPGGFTEVTLGGGVVIAGGTDLLFLNPATGDTLAELELPGNVVSIAVEGGLLAVSTTSNELHAIDISSGVPILRGSVDIPAVAFDGTPAGKVFLQSGIAYVSNGNVGIATTGPRPDPLGGYATFDLSDPTDPALISAPDTPGGIQATNLDTITNGSGLAVVAAGPRGLQIHGASDASNTYDLITEIDTPGSANAVALASGIAYVADGSGGLQVINFLPFDAGGVAPTVTIDADAIDADPNTDGIQVEEGRSISVSLTAEDDVQVRNVQLLLNGEIVQNDVSAPYDLNFIAPPLAGGSSTLEVEVQAFDTGGNASMSNRLTFEIIPDITPPEITSVLPDDGALVLQGRGTLQVRFSEAIDADTLTIDNFLITNGSVADPIAAESVTIFGENQFAVVTFGDLPLGSYEVTFDPAGVTDRAGNEIQDGVTSRSFEVVDASSVWVNEAGGNWTTATNWQDGTVPDANDIAFIPETANGVDFSISSSSQELIGLRLGGDFSLSRGEFSAEFIDISSTATFTVRGGLLSSTTVSGAGAFLLSNGSFSNVVIENDALFNGSSFSIEDGLAINGSLTVAENTSTGSLTFRGSQTIEGAGEIAVGLNSAGSANSVRFIGVSSSLSEVLTFGEDLTVRGLGTVSASSSTDALRFLGDVIAEGGGLTLTRVDQGGAVLSVSERDGGQLSISDLADGVVDVAAGSDVDVSGTVEDVTIAGAGQVSFGSVSAQRLDVQADAEVEALASARTLTIDGGLNVDGRLGVAGSSQATATLRFEGEQTVTGTGTIDLSRGNAIGSEAITNRLQFAGNISGVDETLTFGEGLTLRGDGSILGNGADDIRILGTVQGVENGLLTLSEIDNDGAALRVDASAGGVAVQGTIEETVFEDVAGQTGRLELISSELINVTLGIDAFADSRFTAATFQEGLRLDDATLSIEASSQTSTTISINGIGILGTGEVVLSDVNRIDTETINNQLTFRGVETGAEAILIDDGITVRGTGTVSTSSGTGDTLDLQGTLLADNGLLSLGRVGQAVTGTIGATADGVLSVGSGLEIAEQGTLSIGISNDGNGRINLSSGALLQGGTIALDVADDFTANLGDEFLFATSRFNADPFQGAFDGFQGFDLEGDQAFTIVEGNDGTFDTLSLRVVSDTQAIADGTIGGNFTPAPITVPQRQEIQVDVLSGVTQFVEITGRETGTGPVTTSTNTTTLNDVVLSSALEVEAPSTRTTTLNIEAGLTLNEDLSVIGNADQTATLQFWGTQTVDGTGDIILSRENEINDGFVRNAITFSGRHSGDELLTFGEEVDFIGTGSVSGTGNGDFVRILGDVVATEGQFLTIRDLDNAGADLGINSNDGTVVLDDDIRAVRLVDAGTDSAVVFASGTRLIDVALGVDGVVSAPLSGFSSTSVTVNNGLTLEDSALRIEGTSFDSATLTFSGEQTIAGTGTILLSDVNAVGGRSVQNTLTFSGVSQLSETFTVEDGVTIQGAGTVSASLGTGDIIDLQGRVIADNGFLGWNAQFIGSGYTLGATDDGRLSFSQDLTLTTTTDLELGFGAQTHGRFDVIGETTLAGDLTLTLANGATDALELGDEFRVFVSRDGFTGQFDALNGFDFAGENGFALIEDGDSLFLRVVGDAQAGQFLQRSDLPADPDLPDIARTLTDVTLDAALIGGPVGEIISSTTFQNVSVAADATALIEGSDTLSTFGDFALDGTFLLAGSDRTATLQISDAQMIGGTGEIVLSDQNETSSFQVSNSVRFSGVSSSLSEVLTFGEDLTVRGLGTVSASSSTDALRFLGDVIAEGGGLTLTRVDQGGAVLSVSERDGGQLSISDLADGVVDVAAGSDVDVSGTVEDVTIAGAGQVSFGSVSAQRLDVQADAEVEALASARTLTIDGGLNVDGRLGVAGSSQATATLRFEGEQTVTGTGTIDLSRGNAIGSEAITNRLQFAGNISGVDETLTFGEGLTLRGDGSILGNGADDIRILGTVQGVENGLLTLSEIDNDGAALRVDASAGGVAVQGTIEETVFEDVAGQTGRLELISSELINVTLGIDAFADSRFTAATFQEGLRLDDATLSIEASSQTSTTISINGIGILGTGEVVLSDVNRIDTETINNQLTFRGVETGAEAILIDDGITVRGTGTVSTSSGTGDTLDLQGTLLADNGLLSLGRVGQAVTGTIGATADGVLSVGSGLEIAEQGTLSIGISNDGNGRINLSSGALLQGGTIALDVADDFTANLGDEFLFATSRFNADPFQGAFDGFQGFDLEGDQAFTIVEGNDGTFDTLSLRVVSDTQAIADGTIGGNFTPAPITVPQRQEIQVDVLSGVTQFVEITGRETGTGPVTTSTNTTTLNDVVLSSALEVEAPSTRTTTLNIEAGLTLNEDLSVIGNADQTATLQFWGTQTVDGTGDIILSRENEINDGFVRNAITFSGRHSGDELLTFGEEVDFIGTGSVSGTGNGDFVRILGDVVATEGQFLTIRDLDNAGADLGINSNDGTVVLDDDIRAVRLVDAGTDSAVVFASGTRLIDVALGVDGVVSAPLSGFSSTSVTVNNGLTLEDSALRIEGTSFDSATLTFSGEQTIAGTGTILLSDVNAVGGRSVQNTLTFSGVSQLSETFTVEDGVTIQGAGTVSASLGTGDIIDLQGRVIADNGFLGWNAQFIGSGYTLGATDDGRLSFSQDLTLTTTTDLELGFGAQTHGRFDVIGETTLAGDLTLTLANGATDALELGDEFRVFVSRDGFTGQFDALNGFDFAGENGFALIEDGDSLFLRVVGDAQAGQFLQRSDLPADPDLPDIARTLTDVTLDAALIGGPVGEIISSTTFQNVSVAADATALIEGSDTLSTFGDFALDGTFLLAGSDRTATLQISDAQMIGGTGEIVLSDQNETSSFQVSNSVRFSGVSSSLSEVLTFGEDLTVRGLGTVSASSSTDALRFLGDVIAEGGGLTLTRVDQGGAVLSVSERDGGQLSISDLADGVVDVAAGSDVDVSGTVEDVTIAGAGQVSFGSVSAQRLDVQADAEVEALASARTLTIDGGLNVDGRLGVAGSSQATATLRFEGEQTVTGTGTIDLSRGNAIGSEAITNRLQFAGNISGVDETLTFGEGLTLRGDGSILGNGADDIRILGTVQGVENGLLTLSEIDNDGAALRVDASAGGVAVQGTIEETVFEDVAGQTGRLELISSELINVTLGIDAFADSRFTAATFQEGLRLDDATLSIEASSQTSTTISINGIGILGTGEVVLSDVNRIDTETINNQLTFRGVETGAEAILIDDGITVRGTGTVSTSSGTGDTLDLQGTLLADNGLLSLGRVGQAVTGTIGATADGVLSVGSGLEIAEQGTLSIGISNDGNGRINLSSGALLQGGTIALDVADDFTANLGDEFLFATSRFNADPFQGAFDGFQGFDLEGDQAFTIVEGNDGTFDTLSLRVVSDTQAIADGTIGAVDEFLFL